MVAKAQQVKLEHKSYHPIDSKNTMKENVK